MRIMSYILLFLFLLTPFYAIAGDTDDIDIDDITIMGTDDTDRHLAAYYDLRQRKTFIQVTNLDSMNHTIHVQIFQQDRDCAELDFDDELTPNDTVIYDMDNIIRNNGNPVPVNLLDDSYGYVVITVREGDFNTDVLIGNFRIIDDGGYEYRTNTVGIDGEIRLRSIDGGGDSDDFTGDQLDIDFYANFNTVDGAMFADVVGFAFDRDNSPLPDTVINIEKGVSFDIFVYDLGEEPLSCDRRNFACGPSKIMNYGVNEDYVNSRGGPLLCPGGGLANPDGGYVLFTNPNGFDNCDFGDDDDDLVEEDQTEYCSEDDDAFVGLIGINNGNGTGSMDIWQLIVRNAMIVFED